MYARDIFIKWIFETEEVMSPTALNAAQAALARAKAQKISKQYQETQTLTTSPGHLVVMLYEGSQRYLKQARIAIYAKNIEEAHVNIRRAQDIFAELDATLDMNAGDVSERLRQIYAYIMRRLLDANIQKSADILDELLPYIESLTDAWKYAIQSVEGAGVSGVSNGVAITMRR